MLTRDHFMQGMTIDQYLAQMTTNKEKFLQLLDEGTLSPEDEAFLRQLGKKINCLVITEDWCGDALYNFPILIKMVRHAPNVEARVFLRDRSPELMDQYLKRGLYRSIPVFVFFDEDMNELARFVERPSAMDDIFEKRMLEVRRALRDERKGEFRQMVVDEIKTLLKA